MTSRAATSEGLVPDRRAARAPLMAWPGCRHLASSLAHAARGTLVFAVVYGGADLIARLHTHRVSSYLRIDDLIPLVPWTTVLYSSLWIMFALVPFILRREEQLRELTTLIQAQIVIAGAFFLAAPMPDRPPVGDLGTLGAAFRAADLLNLEFNQFPSLHAAFGFTLGRALGRPCGSAGRAIFAAWSVAIGAAAVLTWQHAVLDILGGAVLAALTPKLLAGLRRR